MIKIEFSFKYEYKPYTDAEMKEMKAIYDNVEPLVKIGEINKALQIVEDARYKKYPLIQYYRVLLLIETKDLLKAYKIANKFPNYKPLRDLKKQLKKELDEARQDIKEEFQFSLFHGNIKEAFKNIHLDRLHNLDSNIIDELFGPDEVVEEIKVEKIEIEEKLPKPEIIEEKVEPEAIKEEIKPEIIEVPLDENNNIECINLLDKLYKNEVTITEIENSNLSTFQKTILIIGYYEKNNRKQAIYYIKKQKHLFANDEARMKILNKLDVRLKNNRIVSFEYLVYQKYLGISVNKAKEEQISEVKETKEKSPEEIIEEIKEEKEVEQTPEVVEPTIEDNQEIKQEEIIDPRRECQELITKLYLNNISLDEINNSHLTDYEKIILTIGYYERYNKKLAIDYIKQHKKDFPEKSINLKNLNLLDAKIKNSHLYSFDIFLYQKCLDDCSVLYDELDKFTKKEEPEQIKLEVAIKAIQPTNYKVEKPKPKPKKEYKYVSSIGVSSTPKVKTSNANRKPKSDSTGLTIRDLYADSIDEIGSYIYTKMNDLNNIETQKRAIKAWENLDLLSMKKASDEKAVERMKKLIEVYEQMNVKPKIKTK